MGRVGRNATVTRYFRMGMSPGVGRTRKRDGLRAGRAGRLAGIAALCAVALVQPWSGTVAGPMPVADAASIQTNASTSFAYTGSEQSFVVPQGVTMVHLDAVGAAGGGRGAEIT